MARWPLYSHLLILLFPCPSTVQINSLLHFFSRFTLSGAEKTVFCLIAICGNYHRLKEPLIEGAFSSQHPLV